MSQTSKIVLGIAVVAVVLIGGFYYWHQNQKNNDSATNSQEVTNLPSGSKTDDASLEQDFSSVDTQLQGVASDNADAKASVNAAVSQ